MNNKPTLLRLGQRRGKLIDNDFPSSAITALSYVIDDLDKKSYLAREEDVIRELNRIGRFTSEDLEASRSKNFISQVSFRCNRLDWTQIYIFCERLYDKLLQEIRNDFEIFVTIEEIRNYFTNEINQILDEENLAYYFKEGKFIRRGSAQTQKAFARVGTVLSDSRLDRVKKHFNKARDFFNKRPEPDVENCVKEALCSLEACFEVLTGKQASKDFDQVVRQLRGNEQEKIPAPIVESMIKLHGYRGSGQGVSHAASEGNRVSLGDAE